MTRDVRCRCVHWGSVLSWRREGAGIANGKRSFGAAGIWAGAAGSSFL
jgi:hypothetical protein